VHLDFADGYLEVVYIVKPAGNFFKLQGKKGVPSWETPLKARINLARASALWQVTAYIIKLTLATAH
jgi:hypothetical protein